MLQLHALSQFGPKVGSLHLKIHSIPLYPAGDCEEMNSKNLKSKEKLKSQK